MGRIALKSLLALIVMISSSANGADIIWIHQMRGGGDGENNTARGEGTLTWEEDQWRQLIEGQGHSIISHDFYDDLETLTGDGPADRVEEFNAADLVILTRDSNSGDYNDESERFFFTDGFESPMIIMTPYLLRSSRFDMVASTTIQDAMNPMVPQVADHPIFDGVEPNADGQIEFWSQLGEEDHIDLVGTTDFGFAEVIATEAETDIPWIAYWDHEANDGDFYDGSSTFAVGPRLFLSAGSDDDPNTWGEKNITPAGDKIVLNAIAWLTGDPGNPICQPGNGDIDNSGTIDFADFLILSGNFGQPGDAAGGDIDCSGNVDFADFLVLSGSFGESVGRAATVPEPNGSVLCGMAVVVAALLRKRR